MAPPKALLGHNRQNALAITSRKGVTTRSQNAVLSNVSSFKSFNHGSRESRAKRKAEASPPKEKTTKRTAFANITNAIVSFGGQNHASKKTVNIIKPHVENNAAAKPADVTTLKAVLTKSKPATRVPIHAAKSKKEETTDSNKSQGTRHSSDLEKSEDNSLYVSALEDATDSMKRTRRSNSILKIKEQEKQIKEYEKTIEKDEKDEKEEENSSEPGMSEKVSAAASLVAIPKSNVPDNVQWDFDIENWLDPFQVSIYAMDIFNYLKEREVQFPIGDYMERQVCLSRWMRALLIDWMVEVQESFELNHETLYLAVKLVDLYLTKVTVGKETLQLLGASSLFIASKFDERIPPMVEDFLYICDGAYSQRELIRMEMNILKVVNFDLGIPLSYRFLRRYARCAKVSMPTLTLARYILEFSLMEYSMITFSDSKMAAAALLLAMLMKDLGGWNPTLEYYSGYKLDDIRDICNLLNETLHKNNDNTNLKTIRNKYKPQVHSIIHSLSRNEVNMKQWGNSAKEAHENMESPAKSNPTSEQISDSKPRAGRATFQSRDGKQGNGILK